MLSMFFVLLLIIILTLLQFQLQQVPERADSFKLSISLTMINKFYERLARYNFSWKTVENYTICLNKFWEFCFDIWFFKISDDPEKINKLIVDRFISHMQNIRKVEPRTINLYLCAIRSYLKFLYTEEERSVLDWRRIVLLRYEDKPINFLERTEIDKLVNCAKMEKEPLKRVRNSLMIKMLFTTWLRVSELTEIKAEEIRPEMQVIGKWRKIRTIYVPQDVLDLANFYIWTRSKKIESDWLFCSHAKNSLGKRLSRNAIEWYMREYWQYCGIKKKTNPHVLRHSFATAIYRKWALSKDVQVLLWHRHLQTTEKYLRTNCEYIKKAAMLAR